MTAKKAAPAKAKREAIGIKNIGGHIVWATEEDKRYIDTIKNGQPVKVTKMRNDRNLKHHRKAFALINLGFEYWTPVWEMVSEPERWVAHKVAATLGKMAGDATLYENVTKEIADSVIQELAIERQRRFDPNVLKTPEAFRAEMLIKAGMFDVVRLPGGGTYKQPHSMSFASMNQDDFNDCYKRLFGAIWNAVLFQQFDDEATCQRLIDQLSGF